MRRTRVFLLLVLLCAAKHVRLSDGKAFQGWEREASYREITIEELP